MAAAGILGNACAASVGLGDEASGDDAGAAVDAHAGATLVARVQDISAGRVAPPGVRGMFVVRGAFTVLLNDSACSHHSHSVAVTPGEYLDDTPVHYLGGSHEVVFRPSELVLLEDGERIPFATIGPGPGHGHCGTAWRTSAGPPEPNRGDRCTPLGTAICEG